MTVCGSPTGGTGEIRAVGLDGKSVGIDRFGLSGPGGEVMKVLGITAEHLVSVARS